MDRATNGSPLPGTEHFVDVDDDQDQEGDGWAEHLADDEYARDPAASEGLGFTGAVFLTVVQGVGYLVAALVLAFPAGVAGSWAYDLVRAGWGLA